MPYPDENTPEFWDLVASGYRQLLDNPPKFVIPGLDRETQYAAKIKEAEERARELRMDENLMAFTPPTKEVEESISRKEAEIEALGAVIISCEPKVKVTEDVWREVFKLD